MNQQIPASLVGRSTFSIKSFGALDHKSGVSLRRIVILSTVLASLIFILISLGGLVRNAGAGLSCPDWPLCFGKVIPPMDVRVFLEWFHRLIAGGVSTFLLGISAYVFMKRDLRKHLGLYCGLALFLLFTQILLGGLTVLGLLNPKWVVSHLGVGLAFYGTIVLINLEARYRLLGPATRSPSHVKNLTLLAIIATVALYGQTILGGLVSSQYAGLACPDFPTCFGQWIPPFDGLVRFQFLHRVGALIVTVVISSLIVLGLRSDVVGRVRGAFKILPVLLFIQIGLGIGSVLWQLPLLMSVAHLAMAAALLGTLLVVTYELRRCEP